MLTCLYTSHYQHQIRRYQPIGFYRDHFFSWKKSHFSTCSASALLHKLSCPPLFVQGHWECPKHLCPICTTQPFVLEGCGEAHMTAAFGEHAMAMHPGVRVCIQCTWRRRESFVGAGRQKRERRVFAEACVINSSWGKSWELGERLCLLIEFSKPPPTHTHITPSSKIAFLNQVKKGTQWPKWLTKLKQRRLDRLSLFLKSL